MVGIVFLSTNCVVPINLVGAGRECQHSLGPHWQVSLIITGQVRHRGTESLLTLMLYVPASACNFLQKICYLGTTSKRKKRTKWIFSRNFEGDIRDSKDRWSLKLIVSICGSQVQTNACMASQRAEIIISQWGHYWQQENPSVETPDTPHWAKTPEWGNLHDHLESVHGNIHPKYFQLLFCLRYLYSLNERC